MDHVINPYTPGAGTPPLVLAGRDDILRSADTALKRVQTGRSGRSQMLLGLRGVGKTVLLNNIFNKAEDANYFTIKIEAPENGDFAQRCLPELKRILLRLSTQEKLRRQLDLAGAALRNFASIFKLSYEGFEFGATPHRGLAETGDFETDFSEMMRYVLTAAKAADRNIALFVDEVQYLKPEELAAITVTCHDAAQRSLPFLFFGAGLPQIAKLAGDAKSYAERLYEFPEVGSLSDLAADEALRGPAQREGVEFEDAAVNLILERSRNYPYFLQVWGDHVWKQAGQSPISVRDVRNAEGQLVTHLDENFFRVRFDRCKPVQQKYLRAMAELGPGPHATGEIASTLGCEPSQVSTTRAQLISLGMIWSQRHGETAFTVPLFDEFMKRQMPKLEKHVPRKRK
ncbi:ATP-binding protein [Rhodobacteraceae bacterium 63075]|nr:ATP-binding protein [Rhodobacteraceae bacterium 63075]